MNVQGSLENPPIIIRQSRFKLGAIAALGLFLTAFCYGLMHAGLLRGGRDLQHLFVGALGLCTIGVIWMFVRPGVIEAKPSGLSWRPGFRDYHCAWADIDEFSVFRGPGLLSYPRASFASHFRDYPISRSWFMGTLGSCWEVSPSEVVNVLNAARGKWRFAETNGSISP